MWNTFKTVLLVTLVTALIWVFAESETLQAEELSTELELVASPVANRALALAGADHFDENGLVATTERRITIFFEGSATAVDRVRTSIGREPLSITPDLPAFKDRSGEFEVPLRELLRTHPRLAGSGVTVQKVEPETIRVVLDDLVTRRMRVEAILGEGQFDGLPDIRPAEVDVVINKAAADSLGADMKATALINADTAMHVLPGRKETLNALRVQIPETPIRPIFLQARPPVVDITFGVRARSREIKLANVPVAIRITPAEINRWIIEVPEQDRFLADVTISGPADLVRQLEERTTPIVAEVPLSFEELERSITQKDAIFPDVPAGLKIDVANRVVRLKITAAPIPPKE